MKRQNAPLLYNLFESLISTRGAEIAHQTAVWHVPDPRQLERATEAKTDTGRCNKPAGTVSVHSITFETLILMVSRLANRIFYELRENELLPNDISDSIGNNKGGMNNATIQENTVIAIFMPPGIDRIVAQIACMKLRLAYLPLDRQLSTGRIQQILELIRPVMVITAKKYLSTLLSLINEPLLKAPPTHTNHSLAIHRLAVQGILIKTYTDLINTKQYNRTDDGTLCESRINSGKEEQNSNLECFSDVKDPVIIVLFTSGSTSSGPKIVRLRNQQLLNRFQWQWNSDVQLNENQDWCCRVLKTTPVREVHLASTACVFVDAFTELFGALFAGIPVVVPGGSECASEVCVSDLRIVIRLIRQFHITRLTTVPMQLKVWIQQGRLIPDIEYNDYSTSLNTVVVSGDILLPQLAEEFFPCKYPHRVQLINFYGTTEVAGDVTAAVFRSRSEVNAATKKLDFSRQEGLSLEDVSFLAVGKPISNTAVYIVRKCEDSPNKPRDYTSTNGILSSKSTAPCGISQNSSTKFSVIGMELYPIDWEWMGYELCEKGCVGEVAIAGLPIERLEKTVTNRVTNNNGKGENQDDVQVTYNSHTSPCGISFPGDLGFICPEDNLLYICGRSDELVKINAVGFLAGDVDRLLLRIKENGIRGAQHMSSLESKLVGFRESVTLPIKHPVNKSSQLVCFYAVDPKQWEENVPLVLSVNSRLNDQVNYDSETKIIRFGSVLWTELSPKPCELSAIITNYVPVYIRPVFVPVTRIPIMPTSGKVDKQLLRALYEEPFSTACGTCASSLNMSKDSTDHKANGMPCPTAHNENGINHDKTHRELARGALMKVLGLQPASPFGGCPRPRDDEDFYLLGGNSLLAVLALETLRQLGFNVHLETFYHTGNIGQILDSLVHSDYSTTPPELDPEAGKGHNGHISNGGVNRTEEEYSDRFQNEAIEVVEWDVECGDFMTTRDPKYEDIRKLLMETFEKKDVLTHAFGLTRADLEYAVATYFKPNGFGTVLLALCPPSNALQHPDHSKLVGVILAVPSEHIPELPPQCTRLNLLQKYFDFCCSPSVTNEADETKLKDPALTVIMVGVLLSSSDEFSRSTFSVRARWNRVMLEILARLERQLVEVAKAKGFGMIETLNTCDITREVCMDLGYRLIKTTRMQAFASEEHIDLDPKYNDHHSYYMVKYLNDHEEQKST